MMYPSRDTLIEFHLESPVMDDRKDAYMSGNRTDEVHFSPAQLGFLEANFPAVVLGPSATEGAMRHYFGQQAVIEMVRRRTRGLGQRTVQIGVGDIPPPN